MPVWGGGLGGLECWLALCFDVCARPAPSQGPCNAKLAHVRCAWVARKEAAGGTPCAGPGPNRRNIIAAPAPCLRHSLPRHDRVARILSSSTTNDSRWVPSPARRKMFILEEEKRRCARAADAFFLRVSSWLQQPAWRAARGQERRCAGGRGGAWRHARGRDLGRKKKRNARSVFPTLRSQPT
jgi:hypothetical protein